MSKELTSFHLFVGVPNVYVLSASGTMLLEAPALTLGENSAVQIVAPSASNFGGTNHGYAMKIVGTNSNGGGMICLEEEGAGTRVTGFRAPDAVSQDLIYELPDDVPEAGEVLKVASYSSPVATLEWAADSTGGGGGSTNAAGSDTHIQFNDGGTNFGGSANLIWDDTALKIASTSSGTALLELKSTAATSATAHGPFLDIRRDVTPSDNHELGRVRFLGDTSTGSNKVYGAIMCETVDVTNGSIEGVLTFESAISNSNTEIFKAGAADTSGTEAVFPATNNAIDLGTSSLGWKDLYVSGDIYAGGTAGVTTTASGGTDHVDAVIGVEIIPGEFGGPDQVNLTTVQLQFTKGVLTRIQA